MEPYIITKTDVKALRTCDRLCLRYDKAQGLSQLECIKSKSGDEPWEQAHHIRVTPEFSTYAGGDVYKAFELLYLYKWDRKRNNVGTAVDAVREGDILTLKWGADNNSNLEREANLHFDQAELIITRSKKTYVYLLTAGVFKDNSARMCQVYYSIV